MAKARDMILPDITLKMEYNRNYLDAAKCIQTNLFKSPCLIFDLLCLMVEFTIVSKPTSPKHYIQVIQYDLVQQWELSAIRIYFIHAFSTPIIRRTFEPSEKILTKTRLESGT